MKLRKICFYIALALLLVAPITIAMGGVSSVNGEEVKNNDDLYSRFQEPASDMSSKPLFFWNKSLDMMTEEKVREIVRRSYLESGYSGFGILPFWQKDYLSEKYFELYEAALDEGSKYGMKFSLYDENGYPTYTAGGLFADKYPELTAKRVDKLESSVIRDGKIFLELPNEKLMGAVLYNTVTNEMIDITDEATILDVPELDTKTQPVGIVASSYFGPGYEIDKAFDGDKNTRWNAADYSGGRQYIIINYGKKTKLDTVELFEDVNADLHRVKGVEIQYWNTNTNEWITLGSASSITNSGARISFDAVEEQYYRIYFKWVNNAASINEINLYADGVKIPNPPVTSNDIGKVDITSEAMEYFSSSDFSNDYTALKAFDNNNESRWNAAELGNVFQWIGAKYANEVMISSVSISEVFDRIRSFEIQYLDGDVWKTITTGTTLGGNYEISFTPVKTTAIRLLINTDGLQIWETPSISEFKIYADGEREYRGSYIEYPVSGDNWKIMAFICVSEGVQGMDYFSEEAVDAFIEITYEEYYKRFKKYFDNGTITSAFYDEPSWWGQSDALTAWGVSGGRMWTDDFNEVFKEMFGEDENPVLCYAAMWYDIGEMTVEARDKINAVRTEMFAKHYIGRINDWCEEHGIELMGHLLYEDIPNPVPSHGDLMYAFKYQDCPSVDVIASYQMTEDYYKVISSAAYNWDHAHVGVECYGAISNMPVSVLYKQAMDLFAKGINVMVPHAVWYDAPGAYFPPELSYQTYPYSLELPQYNEYIARLQTMLQEGRHVADIALLYPIDTMEYAYDFNRNNLWITDSNYAEIGELLSTDIRLDFTYLHPSVLDEKVTVNNGTLHLENEINYEDYKVMILPSLTVISKTNLEKIYEFYQSGGIVISVGELPHLATKATDNAEVVRMVEEMFGDKINALQQNFTENINDNDGIVYHLTDLKDLEGILYNAYNKYDVSVTSVREYNGHFTYIHKVLENKNIYFFSNSSDVKIETSVTIRGEFEELELWNPMNGEKIKIETTIEDGMTYFDLSLDEVTSMFVVGCDHKFEGDVCIHCGQSLTTTPQPQEKPKENGCGGSVVATTVGILTLASLTLFISRRKKENE